MIQFSMMELLWKIKDLLVEDHSQKKLETFEYTVCYVFSLYDY